MQDAPATRTPPSDDVTIGRSTLGDGASANDALGFEPYVNSVAAFLLDPRTTPPLTISIEGEWGSGKSSFMLQLQDRLVSLHRDRTERAQQRGEAVPPRPRFVFFNAWRHDTDTSLWASFAIEFVRQLSTTATAGERIKRGWILTTKRFEFARGWWPLLQVLALLVLAAVVTVQSVQHLKPLVVSSGATPSPSPSPTVAQAAATRTPLPKPTAATVIVQPAAATATGAAETNRLLQYLLGLGGFAGYAALIALAIVRARDVLGDLSALKRLRDYVRDPRYRDRLDFIENFHEDMGRIIETYVDPNDRVFVFIDDLDRCTLPKAGQLLTALNVLMSSDQTPPDAAPAQFGRRHRAPSQIVFVLGIDRDKVAASIAAQYRDVLPYVELTNTALYGTNDPTNAYKGLDYGYQFIERFIQVPFRVPQADGAAVRKFLEDLRKGEEPQPRRTQGQGDAIRESGAAPTGQNGAAQQSGVTQTDAADRVGVYLGRENSEVIDPIVLMVAPTFEYNPRRLKQFINALRLNAFIGGETGLFTPRMTLPQLAKLLTLNLTMPRLFAEIVADPGAFKEMARLFRDTPPASGRAKKIAGGVSSQFAYWAQNPAVERLLLAKAVSGTGRDIGSADLAECDFEQFLRVAGRRRAFNDLDYQPHASRPQANAPPNEAGTAFVPPNEAASSAAAATSQAGSQPQPAVDTTTAELGSASSAGATQQATKQPTTTPPPPPTRPPTSEATSTGPQAFTPRDALLLLRRRGVDNDTVEAVAQLLSSRFDMDEPLKTQEDAASLVMYLQEYLRDSALLARIDGEIRRSIDPFGPVAL